MQDGLFWQSAGDASDSSVLCSKDWKRLRTRKE